MRRLLGLAVIVGIAVFAAGAASARPPSDGDTYTPASARGHGVVPTWASFMAMPWARGGGHSGGGGGGGVYRPTYGYGPLQYHGGLTMTTNTTYAIYWQPSNWTQPSQQFPSSYSTLVDRYFGDVAHDSGQTTNVYYTETQYSGIQYSSSFAGSGVDTATFSSDCTDSATPGACVSDSQLQTIVSNYVSANHLPRNSQTEYFVFFPPGLGSCLGGAGCAFTDYCAYHGSAGTGPGALIYANQPYVENVSGCDAGHHPNTPYGYPYGDAVLNVVSHEHNESITDEFGDAWFDTLGYEDGDKCAWSWGRWIGGGGSTVYNQLINGNPYALQLEYSNADAGCVASGR